MTTFLDNESVLTDWKTKFWVKFEKYTGVPLGNGLVEHINELLLAKDTQIAEAEKRGKNMAVDYIKKNGQFIPIL